MFGFRSNQSVTDSGIASGIMEVERAVDADERASDGYIIRFDPYPEMSSVYGDDPDVDSEIGRGHRTLEPRGGLLAEDIDESDPQPGHDDHDYDD